MLQLHEIKSLVLTTTNCSVSDELSIWDEIAFSLQTVHL